MLKKPATLKDIAALAGVSATAVSLALNNQPGIGGKKREQILKIASELEYRPNFLARSMVGKRSNTIGLLINNISDPFYAAMVQNAEESARKNGLSLIVCNVNDNDKLEKYYIDVLISQRVEGIIISSVRHNSPHIEKLVKDGFPFVLAGRRIYDREIEDRINIVVLDNFTAGYQAFTHLYRLGHDRIAILTGSMSSSTNIERTNGALKAAEDHGLNVDKGLVIECGNSKERAFDAAADLLKGGKAPTAIFAEDDNMALSAREAIISQGYGIPEDIALLGFDNIYVGALSGIDLSTVREKRYAIAEQSVSLLLEAIKNRDKDSVHKHFVLETDLVIRKSCGFHLQGYVR
ncbi:MAG TPA: LacI family transcriptional regulator [Desulfobacteraceae bacterium]|nr:LacI family transcriptional regulator [Desulfobacteraceae bacterium]